jgi:hypothetical protein
MYQNFAQNLIGENPCFCEKFPVENYEVNSKTARSRYGQFDIRYQ